MFGRPLRTTSGSAAGRHTNLPVPLGCICMSYHSRARLLDLLWSYFEGVLFGLDDTTPQRPAVDSEEVVERSEEVEHAEGQSRDVPEMGEGAPSKNTARTTLQAQPKGLSPGRSQWRGVAAVSNNAYLAFQRLWQKSSSFNFKGRGQFLFLLVAAIIFLMQVSGSTNLQLVPILINVDYIWGKYSLCLILTCFLIMVVDCTDWHYYRPCLAFKGAACFWWMPGKWFWSE